MPSADDLLNFNRMRQSSGTIVPVIPPVPPLPDELLLRFPSLRDWEQSQQARGQQLQKVLQDLADRITPGTAVPAPIVGDDNKLYTMAVQVIAGVPTAVPVPL